MKRWLILFIFSLTACAPAQTPIPETIEIPTITRTPFQPAPATETFTPRPI